MDSTWEIKALAGIKKNKHLFDEEIKIAEAEALAVEAVRLAEDAELAAARLHEVKKTLSMFLEKLDKVEQTVQKELSSRSLRIEPTTVVEKEPVVLAVEASLTRLAAARTTRLKAARPARLAVPRPERLAAAQSVSILSTKQMEGVEQTTTVQKEVKQHTSLFTEPTIKKEPLVAAVVTAPVIEEPATNEPVTDASSAKDERDSEELTNTTKEDPIEEESTQEEKATIEKSIEESTNKDPVEEQECTKKEIATIETPVTESVTEDPSEDDAESEYEKKEEEVHDTYNQLYKKSMKVKEFTKVVIATVKTLVEAASVKKEEDPSDDESTEGEIAIETVIETGRVVTVLETWKVVTPPHQGIIALGKTTTDSSVDNNRQQDVRATPHKDIVACGKTETGSIVDNNSIPDVVVRDIDTEKHQDVCDNTHNTDKDTGIVACVQTKTGSSSVDNNNNRAPQGVVRVIETGRQQDVRTMAATGHSSTWFGTIIAHSPRSPQSHLRRIFKF